MVALSTEYWRTPRVQLFILAVLEKKIRNPLTKTVEVEMWKILNYSRNPSRQKYAVGNRVYVKEE